VSTPTDIIGGRPDTYLVIGWFTPDYRPLAERFAANIAEHGTPFHLFARPKVASGWNTAQKPDVVLHAMGKYRDKTLVLMDLDCIVHGDLSPVVDVTGDVGITVIARNLPGRVDRRWREGEDRRWAHRIAVECSSRVVVFRPTSGACAFALKWREQVVNSIVNHDEHSMVWAYVQSAGVSFSYIDARYSGREVGQLVDAVIEHDSEHNKLKARDRGGLAELLKTLERRYLRTGRTRARKRQLQDAPVVLQRSPDM
jgi:hypothetical protein